MARETVRPAAVAGSWYPGSAAALTREVDRYLDAAAGGLRGDIVGLISPHAGLMYSGPVAAHAYQALRTRTFDVAVLLGPSHYLAFDGVAAVDYEAFSTPLGVIRVDRETTDALLAASPLVHVQVAAHTREHSLEMQLPFLRRVLPETAIVPLVMGFQTRETITAVADALAVVLKGRRALLVASTDLSHYFDARTAQRLDGRVVELIGRFDVEGLLEEFEQYPEHERGRCVACGGGPALAVLQASRALGARDARVLRYANSGDISGDYAAVVGYLAAVLGTFATAA
jgi:AmmeMemoRadiSam system protein B